MLGYVLIVVIDKSIRISLHKSVIVMQSGAVSQCHLEGKLCSDPIGPFLPSTVQRYLAVSMRTRLSYCTCC